MRDRASAAGAKQSHCCRRRAGGPGKFAFDGLWAHPEADDVNQVAAHLHDAEGVLGQLDVVDLDLVLHAVDNLAELDDLRQEREQVSRPLERALDVAVDRGREVAVLESEGAEADDRVPAVGW